MTSIQLLSDVHLEHRRQGRWTGLEPLAPYLALCGDIGNPATDAYARFLNEQAQRFEKVFVIAGNHECYGRTVPEAEACIEAACARHPEKLVFMNRRRFDIDDRVSVLGTTLWSKIDADVAPVAAYAISDFRYIRGWTVDRNNEAHSRDVAWLTKSLSDVRREGRRAIVMTHHAPTHRSTSAECYASSPLRSVFATDLEHLVRPPVAAWLYGHTHHSNDQVLNGVRLVANQVGYPGEGVRYDHGMAAAMRASLSSVKRILFRRPSKRGDLRISASECASLLGSNRYVSRETMIQRKAFERRKTVDRGSEDAVEHGMRYEKTAIRRYSELLMREVIETGHIVHEEYEWLGATPDGITRQGECLEVKCPFKRKITGTMPKMYMPQVQIELEVCGLEMAHYVEYVPHMGDQEEALLVVPVPRDREWFRQNVDRLYEAYLDITSRRSARGRI